MQGRGKSVLGAFDGGGDYRGNAAGDSEWDLEQDLFGVARVLDRGQVALLMPFIETRRTAPGVVDAGGGIGDIAVSARYDFLASGERRIFPGIALLAGLVAPTGRVDSATPAGVTGKGSFQGSIGIAVEQAYEPFFVTVNALIGFRTPRNVAAGVRESFSPELTGVVAAGRVLPHTASLGVYLSVLGHGVNSYDGGPDRGPIAGTDLLLLTTGLAATTSLSDQWRVQSTAFWDLPIAGFGRNVPTAGIGASVSIIRLWL